MPTSGGANCVYNAGSPPVPLLTNLGGAMLKPLTPAQLTDGPICGIGTNRFDGDLLRVRKVRVSIRVQSSRADLRGADTGQFQNAGGATGGYCAMGNWRMATAPSTMMNSAITHAKIGRSMKNLAMRQAL